MVLVVDKNLLRCLNFVLDVRRLSILLCPLLALRIHICAKGGVRTKFSGNTNYPCQSLFSNNHCVIYLWKVTC
jgi:hypothetical protein